MPGNDRRKSRAAGTAQAGEDARTGRPRSLRVRPGFVIPEAELELRASRSGGPGGQNVNKLATRIELRFDIAGSTALGEDEKRRVRARLAGRISRAGVLRIVAQEHRSRLRNEAAARARLAQLLRQALHLSPARRPTRAPAAAREHRLVEKRRRSARKRERNRVADEE